MWGMRLLRVCASGGGGAAVAEALWSADGLGKEELEELARELGLKVTSGKQGRKPSKADYAAVVEAEMRRRRL